MLCQLSYPGRAVGDDTASIKPITLRCVVVLRYTIAGQPEHVLRFGADCRVGDRTIGLPELAAGIPVSWDRDANRGIEVQLRMEIQIHWQTAIRRPKKCRNQAKEEGASSADRCSQIHAVAIGLTPFARVQSEARDQKLTVGDWPISSSASRRQLAISAILRGAGGSPAAGGPGGSSVEGRSRRHGPKAGRDDFDTRSSVASRRVSTTPRATPALVAVRPARRRTPRQRC